MVEYKYALPRMNKCIHSIGQAQYFTTIDAYSWYWQINIRKQDRYKTEFVCYEGILQFVWIPFGLTNYASCLQQAIDIIHTKYKWKTCLFYLYDVIIFSNKVEDHMRHADEIRNALNEANMTLKINKWHFC